MIQTKSILISSEVSRDGSQFDIHALEDFLRLGSITGHPSNIGHDITQPVGWNTAIAMYFEPSLCRISANGIIAETNEDFRKIHQASATRLLERYAEACDPYIPKFNKLLRKHYTGKQRFLSSTFVSCLDKNIVAKFYPKLFSKTDKNGLIYLNDLLQMFDYKGHGVFKDKKSDFAICAHQYFRRSLSVHNNLNYYFLDHLLSLRGNEEIVLRLKIDPDMLGLAETFIPAMEYEYWRGPKFSEDIPEIKNEVTVHQMDEHNKHFNLIERTEFYRKLEGTEQTFEIEEIRTSPSLGVNASSYGYKYCHSQFDVVTKKFKHFDGAIRMYDTDQKKDRDEKTIKNAGKNSLYTKIFRIDGQLPLEEWQGLIHNYFQGNYLINEYFTGEDSDIDTPIDTGNNEGNVESVLPLNLKPEDGLRVAVSYISALDIDFDTYSHFLLGFDQIDGRRVVEADVVEVKKALGRLNFSLQIPKEVEFIDCIQSKIWNIPEILVRNDENIEQYISAILKAIFSILSAPSCARETISFTVKWKKDDKTLVGVSFAGHKHTICGWITANPTIPIANNEFRDWLDSLNTYISAFPANIDNPEIFSLLNDDGVLYIKQKTLGKYIEPDSLTLAENDMYSFKVKKEYEPIFEGAGRLNVAQVAIIKSSICSGCKEEYLTCPHSYLNDNVRQTVSDFQVVGWVIV